MKTVSVSELKAHLSKYLRVVRRGGEVQVLDRGNPVARLVGLAESRGAADAEARRRLVRSGVLRPGRGGAEAVLQEPPLALPIGLSEALADERRDRT